MTKRTAPASHRPQRGAGGNGCKAATRWQLLCQHAGLSVLVSEWTTAQCVRGLLLIEWAARHERMHLFRDVRTGWRDFVPPCFKLEDVEALEVEVLHTEQVQMMDRRRPRAPEVRAAVIWWTAEDELL